MRREVLIYAAKISVILLVANGAVFTCYWAMRVTWRAPDSIYWASLIAVAVGIAALLKRVINF